MADIAINGSVAEPTGFTGATSGDQSFASSGGTLALLVFTTESGAPSGAGATWNGSEAMVEVFSQRDTGLNAFRVRLYVLQGATTGTHNFNVAFGLTPSDWYVLAFSLDNVAAGNSAGTSWRVVSAATQVSSGTAVANTVSNAAAGDFVVGALVGQFSAGATITGTGQTLIEQNLNYGGGSGGSGAGTYTQATGSTGIGWTVAAGERYGVAIGAALIPAGGGGGLVIPVAMAAYRQRWR